MQDILISPNFHLSELIVSTTASRLHLDNTPSHTVLKNLTDSCIYLWQPARNILGKPMSISSGYRSDAVNKAVGGSTTSAHSYGFAIDFVCPSFGTTRQIAEKLAKEFKAKNIHFDQIILEFPDSINSWVHLGYKNRQGQQRGQLLTAKKQNGKTVYLTGLV